MNRTIVLAAACWCYVLGGPGSLDFAQAGGPTEGDPAVTSEGAEITEKQAALPAAGEGPAARKGLHRNDRHGTRLRLLSQTEQHYLDGDLERALWTASEALQLDRELFGAKDDRVAWRLRDLASYSLELERPAQALQFARESVHKIRAAHPKESWQVEDAERFLQVLDALTTLPRTKRQRFFQATRQYNLSEQREDWQTALKATQFQTSVLIELFGERHLSVASKLLASQFILTQMGETDVVNHQLRRLEKLFPQISKIPNPEYARLFYVKAGLAHTHGDDALAEKNYLRAIGLFSEAGLLFDPDYANTHNDYAVLLEDSQRHLESLRHYKIARDLSSKDQESTGLVYQKLLQNLSWLEQYFGLEAIDKHQWDKAERHLREALEIATTMGEKRTGYRLELRADLRRVERLRDLTPEELEQFDRLALLQTQADSLEEEGEYEEAEALVGKRLQIAIKLFGNDSLEAARAKFAVTWLHPFGDESKAAYQSLAKSFEKLLGNQHREYADILLELVRQDGNLDSATLQQANQAVNIYAAISGKASYDYASALSLYGRILREMEDAGAEKNLLEAQTRWQNLGETTGTEYVDVLFDLSRFYRWLQKQPRRALPFAAQAVDIARKIPDYDSAELSILLRELGLVYDATGQTGRSLELSRESLDLERKNKERDECEFRLALYNVGIQCFDKKDYVAAEKYCRELFDAFLSDPGCYDSCLEGARHLAATYRLLDNYDQAGQVLDKLAESLEKDNHIPRSEVHENRAWIAFQRIAIARDRKQLDSARALLSKLWKQLARSGKRSQQQILSQDLQPNPAEMSSQAWGNLLTELLKMADDLEASATGAAIREAYVKYAEQHYTGKPWLITNARLDLSEARLWLSFTEGQRQKLQSAKELWAKGLQVDKSDFVQLGLPLLQQVLAIRIKILGDSHRLVVSSQFGLSQQLHTSGRFQQAYTLAQQVLHVRKKILGEEHLETALAKIWLGTLAGQMNRYEEAERWLQEALRVQNRILEPDHADTAVTYLLLSAMYMGQGNSTAALTAAIESRRRLELTGRPETRAYAHVLNTITLLYGTIGEKKKSVETLLKWQQVVLRTFKPTDPVHLECALSFAILASKSKQTQGRAAQLFERLFANFKTAKLDRTPRYAKALGAYGDLHQSCHDFAKAHIFFQKSLDLLQEIHDQPDHLMIANAHNRLGLVSLSLGDLPSAESHFDNSFQMRRRLVGEKSHLIASSLYQLARVKALQRQSQAAHKYLTASLEIEQLSLQEKFLLGSDEAIAKVLDRGAGKYALLLTLQAAKRAPPKTVESAYGWTLQRKGRALDMACRMQTAKRSLAHHPEISKMLAEIQSLRGSLTQTAMAQTAMAQTGMAQTATAQTKMLQTATAPQVKAAKTTGPATQKWNLRRIAKLQEQLAFKVRDAGIESGPADIDVAKIRARLPPESALVEFVVAPLVDLDSTSSQWTPQHVLAFYVPAESNAPCRFVDLGLATEIQTLIQELRTHIERLPRSIRLSSEADLERQFQALSTALFQRLLGPFENELASLKCLVLAPDSDLHRIPFAALCRGDGRYLIEDLTVSYVSSGRDLLRDHALPGRGSLILADPDYDATSSERAAIGATLNDQHLDEPMTLALREGNRSLRWRPLPGARQEAKEVQQVLDQSEYLPIQCFVGEKAVEEVLKAAISPRLIHIATHGFYVPYQKSDLSQSLSRGGASGSVLARLRHASNPLLRSGIVLAGANQRTRTIDESFQVDDGLVTAQEISSMDFRHTELVVLSACESGLGDTKRGHGVHGLRRALLIAGAHNLMTSLFEVPDSETRQLMGAFYESLVTNRQAATALRDAQRAIIKGRRLETGAAHPFYWASFFVLGKPGE